MLENVIGVGAIRPTLQPNECPLPTALQMIR